MDSEPGNDRLRRLTMKEMKGKDAAALRNWIMVEAEKLAAVRKALVKFYEAVRRQRANSRCPSSLRDTHWRICTRAHQHHAPTASSATGP